jgi:glycosyltransferase involved in cell wall biosynthesis
VPLVAEIAVAVAARGPFEIVYVDDGSTNATASELSALTAERPWLRQIWHPVSCG